MQEATSLNSLPNDIISLKQMVLESYQEIERLREQIRLMQQRRFGRKSEKSDSAQLSLFDDLYQSEEPSESDGNEVIDIKSHKRKKSTNNRTLPKDLPRETIHYDLSESEKVCGCGTALHKIGEDKFEQLEYIPAQVKVIEHIKAKYSCRDCEEFVKTAQAPKQPIPKSIASPGLLAQTIVSKYADHLPLYRQESIFARIGVEISRATMSNWVFKCAELVSPLVDLLKKQIIESDYVCADETTVQVLENSKNSSKDYMWVYMTGSDPKPAVVFEHHPTREGDVAYEFLKSFKGYLQTDGYNGYNLLRNEKYIIALGCWAHVRRKFFEIMKASKQTGAAHMAVSYINKLYKIERHAQSEGLDAAATKALRQEKSIPILKEFKAWLDKTQPRVPPKSALGLAIQYTLKQWPYLLTYCEDGRLGIDNNPVERMIKPFACGRKNWLFCGNTKGARASAGLYSLLQTCKLNSLDPYKYFRYILTKLPNVKTQEELEALLPQNIDPDDLDTS